MKIIKQEVQAIADLKAGYTLGHADVAILNELARIALASLEAEPAIHRWRRVTSEPYGPYPWHYGDFIGFSKPVDGIEDEYFYSAPPEPANAEPVAWLWSHRKHPSEVSIVRPEDDERAEGAHWSGWSCQALYAEPVTTDYKLPEETDSSLQLRNLIRQRHAEWSQATFGDVGPVGPLKHLSKEALEAAEEPDDLSEWADMQFLLWDAQRRAGISDGEITAAMEEKLKVNMARQWPEPKDGEPRLHIKAAPQQEVAQALAKGMERYGDAMQELAKKEVK